MPFTVNTITLKGAELLAAATAANPLILDGCDATQTYIDQATAVNVSARPASPYSNTTSVSIIGATSNHVVARAQFEAGTNTGGDVNTIYLYGHSQNDPSNVYVVYVCSSQTTVHLPLTTDVLTIVEILCDMIYTVTSGSVLTASTSVFTTLAEFNILKERTVTTHKEGEATTGEAQFIYGSKTFVNDLNCPATGHFTSLIADSGITTPSDIDCNNIIAGRVKTVRLQAKTGSQIAVDTNLVPDNDLSRDLGDSTHRYSTVYASNIDCNGGNINLKGNVIVGAPSAACLVCPTSTATDSSIGTYSYPFNKGYIGAVYIKNESGVSDKGTWIGIPVLDTSDDTPTVEKGNAGIALFDSSTVSSVRITADYDYEGNDTYTSINLRHAKQAGNYDSLQIYIADEEDYKFAIHHPSSEWVCEIAPLVEAQNGLKGTAPTVSSGTVSIPIGGIIMAYIDQNGVASISTPAGTQFTLPNNSGITITRAQSNGSSVSDSEVSLPDGTYVILCDAIDTINSYVLVQRVA